MKLTVYIGLSIFFLLMGCSDHKQKMNEALNDSIGHYIALGGNRKLPYAKRFYYNEKVLPILLQQENDSLNREQLFQIGQNYLEMNKLDEFKKITNIVYRNSLKQGSKYHIALSCFFLGNFFKDIRNNDSAFYYYLKAEKRLINTKNTKLLAELYLNKSSVQIDVFDIYGAERSAIKSLKYSKILGNKLGEYDALINMGISSNSSEDYNKSNNYYYKAIVLVNENHFSKQYFLKEIVLNNLGNNYLFLRDYHKANKLFKEALQNKKSRKDNPRLYSTIIDNLAYSEYKKNKTNNKSLILFLESLRIKDSLKLYSKIVYTKNHISEYYWSINDKNKSLKYAKEALLLSRKTGSFNDLLESLKQLSIVDSKNYPIYSKEYIALSDIFYKKNRIAKNKFAAIAYETEEITNEKDEAIQQKQIFFGIAVLLFIIGTLVVLLLIQRAKQKELRVLQEQQKTNEEIYQLIQNQQSKIDEARHIEKKRIARDLHDGIMNRLSSTRLNLHILNEKATPEIIKKCIPFIAGIQDIEKEIRHVSHDLNKDALFNKVSFVAVVESFVAEQKEHFKGKCHLEIDPTINWEWLTSFQKINIFRILQEAFQNTNKHAQAQNIIISFLKSENQLLLEIFDDGVGFSLKQKKKGIGLQNIYSRAKQCNGNAEIKSEIGTGTTLIITIPLNPIL